MLFFYLLKVRQKCDIFVILQCVRVTKGESQFSVNEGARVHNRLRSPCGVVVSPTDGSFCLGRAWLKESAAQQKEGEQQNQDRA